MVRSFVVFFFLLSLFGHAQERAGLTFGKYNGVNSTHLNPAFSLISGNKWDVQLIGAHAFFNTNYASISNTSLTNLMNSNTTIFVPDEENDIIPVGNEKVVRFNLDGKTHIDAKAEVLGPGVLFTLKGKYKVGLSSKLRSFAGMRKIPSVLNYFAIDNMQTDSIYILEKFNGSASAWQEYAAHFAMSLNENLSFGVNLKYLQGMGGAWISNDENFSFQEFEDESIEALSDGAFSFAYNEDYETVGVKGRGMGLDIGMIITSLNGSGNTLGISLIDVGLVRYGGSNQNYSFTRTIELNEESFEDLDEDNFESRLREEFTLVSEKNSFNVLLPTALSVQYKMPFTEHFSLEASLVQRLKVAKQQLSRSNSINMTAVYDRKFFSAFVPISVYEYRKLMIGAAVRLGFITIGSDRLGSIFGNRDFNGSDVYVNINLFPFGKKSNSNSKSVNRKEIKCYF